MKLTAFLMGLFLFGAALGFELGLTLDHDEVSVNLHIHPPSTIEIPRDPRRYAHSPGDPMFMPECHPSSFVVVNSNGSLSCLPAGEDITQ